MWDIVSGRRRGDLKHSILLQKPLQDLKDAYTLQNERRWIAMSRAEQVEKFVAARIGYLSGLTDRSRQKALLAELRRGVGRKPGDIPQLWGLLFSGLPEDMMSKSGEPRPEEWAIYTTLTLYAYHQQGRDPGTDSVNAHGIGIGRAVASMVHSTDDLERLQSRFNRFATSVDMPEAVTHLRGIIGLLKAELVGLDYPRLAKELYQYQFYDGAKSIRLSWGQDLYRNLD